MDPEEKSPGDLKDAEKKEVVISDCPVQAVVVYPDRAEVRVRGWPRPDYSCVHGSLIVGYVRTEPEASLLSLLLLCVICQFGTQHALVAPTCMFSLHSWYSVIR